MGYGYGEAWEAAEKEKRVNVKAVPSDLLNFDKLLLCRIDATPLESAVGLHIIRVNFTPEEAKLFTYHPKILGIVRLRVLISKRYQYAQELIQLYNKGYKMLVENGKYDQMMENCEKGYYSKE